MIKRIKISDFRSIRALELELDPVTVLVGRSGTGKSNVVQAIRFLRNVLLNQSQALAYEGGWSRIVPVGERKPKTTIEVVFSLPGEPTDYNYRIAFGMRGNEEFPTSDPVILAERFSIGGETIFSRIAAQPGNGWVWEKAPNLAVVPGQSGVAMLGSLPSLQKAVFAYAALSTGIGFYHFPSTALRSPRTTEPGLEFLQPIPSLSDHASNFLETMKRITQDFNRPGLRRNQLASLKAINPSIVSVELDSMTNPQRAIVAHEAAGSIFELSLEQESDGTRRFYAHLLALYQTPTKLVMVFEEPENAIFPGALELLADEFKAAPGDNRGQVILTTHNPKLLDSFDVENVRVVKLRDGRTEVGPVSTEQREAVKDRLMTTGELLTTDPARLDEKMQSPQPA